MRALACATPQVERLPDSCFVSMSRHSELLLPAVSLHAEPLLLLLACWQPIVAVISTSAAKQSHNRWRASGTPHAVGLPQQH